MSIHARAFSIAGLALAFLLTGCAGTGGTNPAGNGAGSAAMTGDAPPAIDGIAGKFNGTVKDGLLGKGTAVFQLTQSVGSAGGSMQLTFGKTKISSVLTMNVTAANTGSGTAIVLLSNPCSLNVTAKYNPKTLILTGKYKGFHNCSQSGSFAAKEECYYVVATPILDIEPRAVPRPC